MSIIDKRVCPFSFFSIVYFYLNILLELKKIGLTLIGIDVKCEVPFYE